MPAMIAYEVLVQTIADWKAGARPSSPTPPAAPEPVEELSSGIVDFDEDEGVAYASEGYEGAAESGGYGGYSEAGDSMGSGGYGEAEYGAGDSAAASYGAGESPEASHGHGEYQAAEGEYEQVDYDQGDYAAEAPADAAVPVVDDEDEDPPYQ